MENNKNLNKKLLELQKVVKGLKKDKKGFGYDYVSGDKLLGFIRPAMDELGLRLVPNTESVEQQMIETVPQSTNRDGSIKPAKNEIYVLLHKTYTWIDVESGETETTHFYSQGCNSFDKAIGSAETYAERYFILKYFHISTDEDDVDAIVREEETKPTKTETTRTTKTTKKGETKQEPLSNEDDVILQDAIQAAKDAKTASELTKVWKDFKPKFEHNEAFVNAIKSNPNHPSHKK